jgi:hypothetical protein
MARTIEDLMREARQFFLHSLTPEERRAVLDELPPEEVVKHGSVLDVDMDYHKKLIF